jgi:hypothetical protein
VRRTRVSTFFRSAHSSRHRRFTGSDDAPTSWVETHYTSTTVGGVTVHDLTSASS